MKEKQIEDYSNLIIERHGTCGGVTNFYRYLSFWIKRNRDKNNPIQEGGTPKHLLKEKDVIKNRAYIVFSANASKLLETNNMVTIISDTKLNSQLSNKLFKSWNIGKYMGHPYKYKNGTLFNEDSLCIELLGINDKGLMEFVKDMCKFGDTIIFENEKNFEIYFMEDKCIMDSNKLNAEAKYLLEARLNCLEGGEDVKILDDTKEIKDKILNVFKDKGIPCDIKNITKGVTYTSVICHIEYPSKIKEEEDPEVKEKRKGRFLEDIAFSIDLETIKENVVIVRELDEENEIEIQVANKKRTIVYLKNVINTKEFFESDKYSIYLGQDVNGNPYIRDLRELPHLFMCGQTGAGKSVEMASILISLMSKCEPEDIKFLLMDPKRTEYEAFNDSPFSLTKEVLKNIDDCIKGLEWASNEMTRRCNMFSQYGTKDITEFNEKHGFLNHLPRILIVIDELSDLIYNYEDEVKTVEYINKIGRLGRSVGIHMIIGSQRPSSSVLDDSIMQNFPSRIAFRMSYSNYMGDDTYKLTGFGDLLFKDNHMKNPIRLQGPFVRNEEINKLNKYLVDNVDSEFDPIIEDTIRPNKAKTFILGSNTLNEDIKSAICLSMNEENGISISLMQRRLGWGWPRAAKVFDQLQKLGYFSEKTKNGSIKLLISEEEAKKICDKKDSVSKYALSKNMIQALAMAQTIEDGIINNVKLQLGFGWKSIEALSILKFLSILPVFERIDEDTLKITGSKKDIQTIIDNCIIE